MVPYGRTAGRFERLDCRTRIKKILSLIAIQLERTVGPPMWIVLILASFLAALISGTAGFGGALLLLPAITYYIGAEAAVPVITLAQLIGNISRMATGVSADQMERGRLVLPDRSAAECARRVRFYRAAKGYRHALHRRRAHPTCHVQNV